MQRQAWHTDNCRPGRENHSTFPRRNAGTTTGPATRNQTQARAQVRHTAVISKEGALSRDKDTQKPGYLGGAGVSSLPCHRPADQGWPLGNSSPDWGWGVQLSVRMAKIKAENTMNYTAKRKKREASLLTQVRCSQPSPTQQTTM